MKPIHRKKGMTIEEAPVDRGLHTFFTSLPTVTLYNLSTQILNKIIQVGGVGYQLLCANCHRKKTHLEGEFGESPSNTGALLGVREEKLEEGSA